MNKSTKLLTLFELFDPAEVDAVMETFRNGIKAPFVRVYVSTLGGADRPTIMLTVSLDPKDRWNNDILENSRYFKMAYYPNGTMEAFTQSYKMMSKFRKTKAKSVDDAIAKINKYIELQGEVK